MAIFDEVERLVLQALAPLRMRFNNMVRRAVIELTDDAPKQQAVQVSLFETVDPEDEQELQPDVERFSEYGFTSRTPVGGECILLRIGASGDHQVVIATALREKRPKLPASGDVALWDEDGQAIKLLRDKILLQHKAGNTIELGGADAAVGLVGDDVLVNGSSDAAFVAFMASTTAAIGVMAASFNFAVGVPVVGLGPGSVVVPIAPSTVTGKILTGSSVVKAKN